MGIRRIPILFLICALCAWGLLVTPRGALGGALTIESVPPGATVEINGVAVGKTPYTQKFPDSYFHPPHSVFSSCLKQPMVARLSLPGYISREVSLAAGPRRFSTANGKHHKIYWLLNSKPIRVELIAASAANASFSQNGSMSTPASGNPASASNARGNGLVDITSHPPEAEVYVDGNFVGTAPSRLWLRAGRHSIDIRLKGRESWQKTLDVLPGSSLSLAVKLEKTSSPSSGGS